MVDGEGIEPPAALGFIQPLYLTELPVRENQNAPPVERRGIGKTDV